MLNFFKKKNGSNWKRQLAQAEKSYHEKDLTKVIGLSSKAVEGIKANAPNDKENLAWAYFLWGRAALDFDKTELAYETLGKSAQLAKALNAKKHEGARVSISLAMAEVLLKMKQYESAKESFCSLEKLLSKAKPDMLSLKVYLSLAGIYEHLRDYDTAIEYFQSYLEALANIKGKEQSNYHGVSQHKDRLAAALEAKRKGYPEPFISISYENGGSAAIDQQYADYLVSELPDPSQKSLDEFLQGIQKVSLLHMFFEDNVSKEEEIKSIENDPAAIKLFRDSLKLVENQNFGHVMGNAHYIVRIENSEKSIDIDFLAKNTIRIFDKWKEDAAIEKSAFLQNWLPDELSEFQY